MARRAASPKGGSRWWMPVSDASLSAVLSLGTVVLMLLLGACCPPAQGLTCPPVDEEDPGPTLEEIYYYSDVVVMGKVTEKHFPGGQDQSQVYTAEMEVYCVYKGEGVQANIRISNAGKPPNKCFSTDFEVGSSYMVYLKQHKNGRLTPAYPQHPDTYKDEMVFICNVTITLPEGLSELPEGVKCEDKPDYDYNYDGGNFEYDDGKENVTCFSFEPKKDPTYETAKTKDQDDNNNNGSGFVSMSLLLLALAMALAVVLSAWS
ncbi:uncharacterized protein LOC143284604 [Babylonia areolata]|uniref:uncharacterized protein LOC143284604 n=1 Tax=Babylonia areolata TaxID=304850 RepID=UPI003FCF79AA